MYGAVRGPTWTRLASSVGVGETTFTLVEAADWQVGDLIVLAQTDYLRWHSAEDVARDLERFDDFADVRTITQVSGDKLTFTVSESFSHKHYSNIVHGVNLQGEVGLLTRNIVVQGDASSLTDHFGAHMMFLNGAHVELVGIEVLHSGQKGFLGRYPIHFHRMGDCTGCIVTDSSMHHNFQRALTVHATNELTIARNVAYLTYGHMYFLEDAFEFRNTFLYNLGITVLKIPTADMLPKITSDSQPAIFWITNPDNSFVHNVAVGSPTHCFWYALPINPLGPSHTREFVPRFMPLLKFAHNTAHSCGSDGLHIDSGPNQDGVAGGDDPLSITRYVATKLDQTTANIDIGANYVPLKDFTVDMLYQYDLWEKRQPDPALIEDYTAWKCGNRGLWTRTGHLTLSRGHFADNAIAATYATSGSGFGVMEDSIVIGWTDNYGEVTAWELENQIYGHLRRASFSRPHLQV